MNDLHELVDAVVTGSVSLPDTRLYYINYRIYTSVYTNGQWNCTDEEVHLGPYPYGLAYYISQSINESHYTHGYSRYSSRPTLSLKPRKGSVKKAGPTQEDIHKRLLGEITDKLDTYRRVEEWFSLSYVPSQTTKKKKGK